MLTSEQALNYQFQKAGMNGYRASEVDEFISAVAETLSFQERKVRDMQRIIDELKKNETIIQTTLINAQKLAMQITEESKQAAEQTLMDAEAKAQAVTADADSKAEAVLADAIARSKQLTAEAESALETATAEAQAQATAMLDEVRRIAAEESAKLQAEIEAQRQLYEALKAEVSTFRSDVLNRYKEQVALIKDLPDLMPQVEAPVQQSFAVQPVAVASEEPVAVADDEPEDDLPVAQISFIDSAPEVAEPSAGSDLLKLMGDMQENEAQAAAAVKEVASLTFNDDALPTAAPANGFTIIIDDDEDDDDNSFSGRIQVTDDNN